MGWILGEVARFKLDEAMSESEPDIFEGLRSGEKWISRKLRQADSIEKERRVCEGLKERTESEGAV